MHPTPILDIGPCCSCVQRLCAGCGRLAMLRIMRLLVCVAGAAALATGPAKHAARPRTAVKAAAAATEQEPLLLRVRFSVNLTTPSMRRRSG